MSHPISSSTLPEVRRSRRTRLVALAKIYDHNSRAMIGYLGDIATGGMMVHTHRELPPPGSRVVTIHLPHPDKGLVAIDAGIRVAWQCQDADRPQRRIGCEFVALDPSDRLLLLQTARSYGIA
ncbi:MAG: PilZ domain-containing protein [Pseudomonadales bacterium]|nr:PilZ domain-containing protein [Pseudomonadales bacterium]